MYKVQDGIILFQRLAKSSKQGFLGYPLKTGYYPGIKKSWKKGRGLERVIPLFAV